MSELTAAQRDALAELILAMADDELVVGYWDSEWTGIAPMLEEDVAMSSISQDEIGHAAALYGMLGELTGRDPDEVAYGRDAAAFRHAPLLDHPRTDWAFTIARRFLYETADAARLEAVVVPAPLDGAARRARELRGARPPRRRRRGLGRYRAHIMRGHRSHAPAKPHAESSYAPRGAATRLRRLAVAARPRAGRASSGRRRRRRA